MQKKIRVPINTPRLKSKIRHTEVFSAKILALIVSGQDVDFRKEFNIPNKGFIYDKKRHCYPEREKWILNPNTGKPDYNCDRYILRFTQLKERFKFRESEKIALEEYLQTGEPIVVGISSNIVEEERKLLHQTRTWETVSLVSRIGKKLKQNKGYKEVADEYNLILKSLNIPHHVTPEALRQVISRANRKLKLVIEERSQRQGKILP